MNCESKFWNLASFELNALEKRILAGEIADRKGQFESSITSEF